MTQAQRKASRAIWRSREVFRYRRWGYWRSDKGHKRAGPLWLNYRAKWWKLYEEARDKRAWYDKEIARHTPKPSVQEGYSPFDGHPTANWIIPILDWARHVGNGHEKWEGKVVSGVRSRAQQWAAAVAYGLWHYPHGNPFLTNHMKWVFPGGAVDVTNPEQLYRVLKSYPGKRKLIWAYLTIGDKPHFSANGH